MRGLIAALLLLGACATGEPEVGPEYDETVDVSGVKFEFGADGAIGISEALPMEMEVIQAAVGDRFSLGGDTHDDGSREITLWISGDVDPDIFIYSTPDGRFVHSIVSESWLAVGPLGERPGALYDDIPADKRAYCVSQMVDDWHGFACAEAPDGRLWRVFRLPFGEIGPTEPFSAITADTLEGAQLVELRWLAPLPEAD